MDDMESVKSDIKPKSDIKSKSKSGRKTKESDSKWKSKETSKETSKSESTISTPQPEVISDQDKFQDMLASFADASSNVEIVFSFDTTGSMSACLAEVRKKVSETVTRLMKDIPNIRIGIIAHGDYCDGKNILSILDLSKDVNEICKFVNTVSPTGGGDAPEAYELVLRDAQKLSWTKGHSKALVMIGDEVPHCPSYTTSKISWFDEVDRLVELGVKIYGVRALSCTYAIPFYEELSERSGAVSINFQSFKLIVDMFLAICYREASPQKLQAFEEEVKQEGKMNAELGSIFQTLSKPNAEIKKEKKMRSDQPWYDFSKDNGKPEYKWDEKSKMWVHV